MIKMMMQFGSYLKYNGFTISPASMNNAIAALEWVELLNHDQVYAALESCLVQSVNDREKFHKLFNKFFGDNTPIELEQENNVFRMQVEQFTKEMKREKWVRLQKKKMILYDVLNDGQLKKYLNADW